MGGVLGANVMRDHNVVFDYDRHLVGFAEGVCDYNADALEMPSRIDANEVRISRTYAHGSSVTWLFCYYSAGLRHFRCCSVALLRSMFL